MRGLVFNVIWFVPEFGSTSIARSIAVREASASDPYFFILTIVEV
jgi:hypothetical protein